MTALIFLNYDCEAIQAAMASALCNFRGAYPEITLKAMGKVCEREAPSMHQYICTDTEMPMSCWLKLSAKWPELNDRLIFNLDEAEKAFCARQRTFNLRIPEERAA